MGVAIYSKYAIIDTEKPSSSTPSVFRQSLSRGKFLGCNHLPMRRAIGFIIVLWGLSHFFGQAFQALEMAATASFQTVEVAATVTQEKLTKMSEI